MGAWKKKVPKGNKLAWFILILLIISFIPLSFGSLKSFLTEWAFLLIPLILIIIVLKYISDKKEEKAFGVIVSSATLFVVGGATLFIGASYALTFYDQLPRLDPSTYYMTGSPEAVRFLMYIAVFAALVGMVQIIAGWKVWSLKNWARYLSLMTFLPLSIISEFGRLNLAIIIYTLFINEETRKSFKPFESLTKPIT